jgi:hypothetical protein
MSLIPTFSPVRPQWRGSTSSEDMNSNFNEILYDLNNIFSEASSLVTDLNNLESRVRHEMEGLSMRLYSVSGVITAYDAASSGYKMFDETFYQSNRVVYPTYLQDQNKCVVNSAYGAVTLPINNSYSKFYSVGISDNLVHLAPDITTQVTPVDEANNVSILDSGQLDCLDGDDTTVWERKVRLNRDFVKNAVSCVYSVTMPSTNNPYVNKVGIKTYPEGTVDIQNVTYDTLISKSNVLPGFPSAGLNTSSPVMYSFNNIQPTKFYFYLRQRNNVREDDYKTFVYGLKNVLIENVEYRTQGKIGLRFDLPSYETHLFKKITSLRTLPDYDNIIYTLRLYPSQGTFDGDIPIWTSSNQPITTSNQLNIAIYATSSIWLLITLNQTAGNSSSPLLNSVIMTYTTTQ